MNSTKAQNKIIAENHLDLHEEKWFAVYTKYKREKIVHKMLNSKGIINYLPIQHVTRKYSKKVRKLDLPLISCYIFVKITQKEYVSVLETENVVNFVRFSKNLISIPDHEIEMMKRIVGEGLPIEAAPTAFCQGDEVEIIGGNLTGLKGKLIEQQGNHQMIVELDNIGYSLKLNVPINLIQKVQYLAA